jgi:hypothetical protein
MVITKPGGLNCLDLSRLILIILFISTRHHNITSFLSLLPERREMIASQKCYPGLGCRIKPRFSRTRVMCATLCATPYPLRLIISCLLRLGFWNYQKFLDYRDLDFETINNFSTIKTCFLKQLRISWLLWHGVWNCRDWYYQYLRI